MTEEQTQTQTATDQLKPQLTRPVDAVDLLTLYDAMAKQSKGVKPTVDQLTNQGLLLAQAIDHHFHILEHTLNIKCSDDLNLVEVPRPYLALSRAVAFSFGLVISEIDKQRRFWKTGTIVLLVILSLLIVKGILV